MKAAIDLGLTEVLIEQRKILIYDLEIIPDLNKALKYWCKLSQFYGKTLRASVSSICCIGWKWAHEKEVHCINAWDFPSWKKDVNDDRAILAEFMRHAKEADAVVTHNGNKFDNKYLQTRLLLHEMELMERLPSIDTRAISSRNFFFIDNKLQTLGEELFGERKLEHEGWDLWVKTHGRDPDALKLMEDYCKQDVLLLEKVYKRFYPVIQNIPNANLFKNEAGGKSVCSRCGSTRLYHNGYRKTKTMSYKRLKCMDCGGSDRTDVKELLPRSI